MAKPKTESSYLRFEVNSGSLASMSRSGTLTTLASYLHPRPRLTFPAPRCGRWTLTLKVILAGEMRDDEECTL